MNYQETKQVMTRYLQARIPFVSFMTTEKQRAIDLLSEVSNDLSMQIYIHSMSKGMYNLTSDEVFSNEKSIGGILDFIAESLKTKENQTFILSDVRELDEDTFTSRYLADIVSMADNRSSSIIVITEQGIWHPLQRLGMSIELDLPNEEELLKIIKDTIEPYQNQITIEWDENDFKDVANILLGITKIEVRNVISTLIAKGKLEKEDLTYLKFVKDNLFSDTSGIEKIPVEDDLVYGGLENLKSWLEDKQKLLDPTRKEEMRKRGMKSPRGILLMGVPGCGKSLSAKAIASKWKMPLYLLDFATIQGRYVGQSEQQLKESLNIASFVAPCILWIDEIEKGLSGVNDSSGVTNRLIGQFLFWLQESKQDVFVIATANNIHQLPPELLRKGRFDEMFFVDLPNANERKEIITLYMKNYLNVQLNEDGLNNLVKMSDKFSGADIEATIRDIAYKTLSSNNEISIQLINETFTKAISSYDSSKESIEKIREWAKGRTIKASKEDEPITETPIIQ